MEPPKLHLLVHALTDDIADYAKAHAFLERHECRHWPGLRGEDLANARLKRMLLDQTFTSVRTLRFKNRNGHWQEDSYRFDLAFYLPRRKTKLMPDTGEATVKLRVDEDFPAEAREKIVYLRPIDLHVAHAVSQMLQPTEATHKAVTMVFAMERMMAAERTCFWKRPIGTLPVREFRLL